MSVEINQLSRPLLPKVPQKFLNNLHFILALKVFFHLQYGHCYFQSSVPCLVLSHVAFLIIRLSQDEVYLKVLISTMFICDLPMLFDSV